jgi:hypothetical protein
MRLDPLITSRLLLELSGFQIAQVLVDFDIIPFYYNPFTIWRPVTLLLSDIWRHIAIKPHKGRTRQSPLFPLYNGRENPYFRTCHAILSSQYWKPIIHPVWTATDSRFRVNVPLEIR